MKTCTVCTLMPSEVFNGAVVVNGLTSTFGSAGLVPSRA